MRLPFPVSAGFLILGLLGAACAPKLDLPPDQIEKLTKLDEVMHVQATVADPQFKKIGEASFTEQDWPALTDAATRLGVTSRKIRDFSKGPEFDALADQLHATAEQLAVAAKAKDGAAASTALSAIKGTCKECHSKFK